MLLWEHKLAASNRHDTARFVFRHYPLDKSCNQRLSSNVNPGAYKLAEGSVCAHEQNKFWDYHDIAFETKGKIFRSVVIEIASSIGLDLTAFEGCLNSGRGLKVVNEDIRTAIKVGIRSTSIYETFVPDDDALFVEREKEAGAIIIGKTNTPEFGAGGNTFNQVFGETLNP